jgi:hypothetical protein
VSCSSTVFCYAVGHGTDADGGPAGGEAVRYSHGWQPAHTIVPDAFLVTVSCTSPSFCMAGSDEGQGVKIYTGAAWSADIVPPYDTGEGDGADSESVSCLSAQFCNVIYYDGDVNEDATIDGAAISTAVATVGGGPDLLPTSCWAVDRCLDAKNSDTYTTA